MKKHSFGKKALIFALITAMIGGEAVVVSAADSTTTKPDTVIGLSVSESQYSSTMYDANGKPVSYQYAYTSTSKIAAGNLAYNADGTKKIDEKTGLYLYEGTYYAGASYESNGNYTTFNGPVTFLEVPEGKTPYELYNGGKGYYTINGKNYTYFDGTSPAVYTYASESSERVFAEGDCDTYYDEATEFYKINGNYYRYAYNNYRNGNQYTVASTPVLVTTEEPAYDDANGAYVVGGKLYSYINSAEGFYYVYASNVRTPYLETEPNVSENGLYLASDGTYYSSYSSSYCGYDYEAYSPIYKYYLSNPVIVVGKNIYYSAYYDSSVGCYTFNGKYYSYFDDSSIDDSIYYVIDSNEIVVVEEGILGNETQDAWEVANEKKLAYAKRADGKSVSENGVQYYDINGTLVMNLYTSSVWNSETYTESYYLYYNKNNTFSFVDGSNPYPYWLGVNVGKDRLTKNGKEIKVAYEIQVDGKLAEAADFAHTYNAKYMNNGGKLEVAVTNEDAGLKFVQRGKSEKIAVRAVYYTTNTTETTLPSGSKEEATNYEIVSVGAWSNVTTFTSGATKELGAPKNFAIKEDGSKLVATFSANYNANYAYVYMINSKTPIEGITSDNFMDYYCHNVEGEFDYDTDYGSISSDSLNQGSSSWNQGWWNSYSTNHYHYAVMKFTGAIAGYKATGVYSSVATLVSTEKKVKLEKVTGLSIVNDDGTNYLTWNAKDSDAGVVVYAYTEKTLPKYFDSSIRSYKTKDGYYFNYSNLLKDKELVSVKNVFSATSTLSSGGISLDEFSNGYNESLKEGQKYFFVAYTYDTSTYSTEKTPVKLLDTEYVYYNDMSAASAVLTATITSNSSATAYAIPSSDSVKITFGDGYDGHIIYRKNAKGNYEKLATITGREYVDSNLTKGTTYDYKVVAYYVDSDTNKMMTTKYASYVSATPGAVSGFVTTVTATSKTKVKVSWTKVANATSYEIYRSDSLYDNSVIGSDTNRGSNWTLIQTIDKATTTSITETVEADHSYGYRVVARYTVGKKNFTIEGSDSVYMGLSTPEGIKGTISKGTAKFTWNANPYAAGYEVSYTYHDQYGNEVNSKSGKVTVKNATVTIKNVPTDGAVTVYVRAYDKGKNYTGSRSAYVKTSLAPTKSVKAAYDAKKGAIKITWSKVSGAKYYRVFRSTYQADYVTAAKAYLASGEDIAAEANETLAISYSQYYGVFGSITGTSAYDYAKLDAGVTYYYTVVAYGAKGTVLKSDVVVDHGYGYYNTYNVSAAPAKVVYAPYKVAISSAKNTAKNTVTLKFNKVNNATSYQIYRSTNSKSGFELIGTSKTNSFKDTKANKKTTYYYKIVTVGTNDMLADYSVTSEVKAVKVTKVK